MHDLPFLDIEALNLSHLLSSPHTHLAPTMPAYLKHGTKLPCDLCTFSLPGLFFEWLNLSHPLSSRLKDHLFKEIFYDHHSEQSGLLFLIGGPFVEMHNLNELCVGLLVFINPAGI